ncbi:MAG: hypothetical protein U9O20_04400 [Patescibacteria group bacterium]|nr:hypothetical protein [Patescibacteria group bacterium]
MSTKKLFIPVFLLSVFVFASCSKKSDDNGQNQQNQQQNNQNQQQIVDPNNQNQQQNNQNQNNNNGQQQVVDPYEGWQTHRNDELGLEFKYPKEYVFDDKSSVKNIAFDFRKNTNDFFIVKLKKGEPIEFYLDTVANSETTIDGVSANIYKLPEGYCDGPGCSPSLVVVNSYKDGTNYAIEFFGTKELDDEKKLILSSFKFL